MNERQMEILRYLEDTYTGARALDDAETMVRISRAIAAFKSDIHEDSEAIFTKDFLNKYYSMV